MDSELEQIRARRLAELNGGRGGAAAPGQLPPGLKPTGAGGGSAGGGEDEAQRAAQQQAEDENRRNILGRILSPEARSRLSRIALVREQRARSIEDLLLRMARSGQLRGRVSEDQLLGLLEQIESSERSQGAAGSGPSKIVFNRRKGSDDESEDEAPKARPAASTARRRQGDDSDSDFDL